MMSKKALGYSLCMWLVGVEALFGSKRRKAEREAQLRAQQLAEQAQRQRELFTRVAVGFLVVLVSIVWLLLVGRRRKPRGNHPVEPVDVVVVGEESTEVSERRVE